MLYWFIAQSTFLLLLFFLNKNVAKQKNNAVKLTERGPEHQCRINKGVTSHKHHKGQTSHKHHKDISPPVTLTWH